MRSDGPSLVSEVIHHQNQKQHPFSLVRPQAQLSTYQHRPKSQTHTYTCTISSRVLPDLSQGLFSVELELLPKGLRLGHEESALGLASCNKSFL